MNRICLKRKQLQRKNSIPIADTENKQPMIDIDASLIPDNVVKSNKSINQNTSNQQTDTGEKKKSVMLSDCSNSLTVFQDFHKQYDEMRIAYDNKRQDYDTLLREKKKIEIQLMNSNPQYYEKQIKRLKVEVQKYQEYNQDHKHKYIIAENGKKQYEATAKLKTSDLKKALQQLEKQKVLATQYKHQIIEKQKFYQRITSQMQKSNSVLSKNFEQMTIKFQKAEANLKSKSSQLDDLIKKNECLQKKYSQTTKVLQNTKQIYDQTNYKKTQIIQQLEKKLRAAGKTSRDTIQGLQFKILEIKNQRKTQNLFVEQKIESATSLKTQRMNQLNIVRLEDINKQLKADFEDKCELIKKLQQKLLKTYSEQQYRQLQQKLNQCERSKKQQLKCYENKIFDLEKQIQVLKIQTLPNTSQKLNDSNKNNDFRQILKVNLEENSKIRSELALKVQQLFNSKSQIEDGKCKLKCSQDQIKIMQKKIKSLEKNHRIETDVSEQNMRNEIDSLKRKIEMMNNKIENKTKEVKQKQNFIINTIVGRSRQEDVPLILSELQRIFETDYSAKLVAATTKIEQLENKLKAVK